MAGAQRNHEKKPLFNPEIIIRPQTAKRVLGPNPLEHQTLFLNLVRKDIRASNKLAILTFLRAGAGLLVGVFMGFRSVIDANTVFPYKDVAYSFFAGLILLAVALYLYARAEIHLADKL